MKTAISIPDPIFKAAERTRKLLGISRSELYAEAVKNYVEIRSRKGIKEALDALYAMEESRLDPVLTKMQALTYAGSEDW